MFTLRCTGKLLKRMAKAPADALIPPTTRLGDWYATILFARPEHLVLAVSARTFLPVLVTARDLTKVVPRIRVAAGEILHALLVPEQAIEAELLEMDTARVAKTASRSIVGTMNEMVYLLGGEHGGSLLDLSLDLAQTPYGALPAVFPYEAVAEVFGSPVPRLRFSRGAASPHH